jgi:hypothetical protein
MFCYLVLGMFLYMSTPKPYPIYNTIHVLWCIVEGDPAVFSVDAPINKDIFNSLTNKGLTRQRSPFYPKPGALQGEFHLST